MLRKLFVKRYSILILGLIIFIVLTGCQKKAEEKMKLYKDSVSLEYGESVSKNINDYLDNSEDFLKGVKIENMPENEPEKSYPAIGDYEIILKKDSQEKKVNIIIKDTIAPVLKNIKSKYEVDFGMKLDIKEIKADDLSNVTISYDDSTVNYKKAGSYEAKIIASDTSGNKAEKKVIVVIHPEKKKENSEKKTNLKSANSSPTSGSATQNDKSNSLSSKKPKKSLIETLKVSNKYSKVFIVSSKSYSARQGLFTYYHKVNGSWRKEFETTAYVGKAGMGKASENSSKTPVGQYTFTKLMGLYDNPGTAMSYHKIDDNDYWCGETYYNQFVDEDHHEHNCSKKKDERLSDYPTSYQYIAAFNYNSANVKGKGSAFFLHCSNHIPYTGGCVAIGISYMKQIMQQIDGNTVMIIDLEKNISQY